MLTRRTLLAAGAVLALSPSAAAAARGDYAIDWQGQPADPAVLARIERQIEMVRAAPVKPEIKAYWAAETIHVHTRTGLGSRAGGGVFITRDPFPDDNPVLLHELIHRWHFTRLANTARVTPLRAAFAAERAAPQWPRRAYMYSNISEYLAMCASVVIHGTASRPPFTREQVRTKLPTTYAFVVQEFGLPDQLGAM